MHARENPAPATYPPMMVAPSIFQPNGGAPTNSSLSTLATSPGMNDAKYKPRSPVVQSRSSVVRALASKFILDGSFNKVQASRSDVVRVLTNKLRISEESANKKRKFSASTNLNMDRSINSSNGPLHFDSVRSNTMSHQRPLPDSLQSPDCHPRHRSWNGNENIAQPQDMVANQITMTTKSRPMQRQHSTLPSVLGHQKSCDIEVGSKKVSVSYIGSAHKESGKCSTPSYQNLIREGVTNVKNQSRSQQQACNVKSESTPIVNSTTGDSIPKQNTSLLNTGIDNEEAVNTYTTTKELPDAQNHTEHSKSLQSSPSSPLTTDPKEAKRISLVDRISCFAENIGLSIPPDLKPREKICLLEVEVIGEEQEGNIINRMIAMEKILVGLLA